MNMLSIQNLTLTPIGTIHPILNNVSLALKENRINLLIGKSGSGKTSLFKCILNLNNHYEGTITLKESCIKKIKNSTKASMIGYVAQGNHLFHHKTVLENCVQPQRVVLKESKEGACSNAYDWLEKLEIAHLYSKYPSQLSGGEQQRVAIARALCMKPSILLLDEPTSALDPETTHKLSQILLKLKKSGLTFLMTTHDMSFAKSMMDYVFFMENGEVIECYDALVSDVEKTLKIQKFIQYDGGYLNG
ncbi:MAG: ATP-binding cassette domain-containing protein [Gammaproteobacteria bacterium]